ncbi:MAG: DUF4115 domain-containing protein [Gammaproteobacteria bacterium]|nr:DUF4115 domain-containing protein [Gammaproteobacteria bacterium]
MPKNTTSTDVANEEDTPIEQTMREHGMETSGLRDAALELGIRIKVARESAKMTVESVGERLKLTPEIIEALENGELETIGEKRLIYIEGYYRAYANILDIDVGDTRFAVDHARPIETGADLSPQINYQSTAKQLLTERLRERSDAIIFGLVAVMVLVVGGVIWLVWPSADELGGSGTTGVVVAPSDPPQAQTSGGELPFYLRDESSAAAENESTIQVSSPRVGESTSGLDGVGDIFAGENNQVAEGSEAQTETPSRSFQPTPTVSEIDDAFEATVDAQDTGVIVITFSGPSWVEVYGANDERLYYKMGQVGEIAPLVGMLPFTVRIGDASVVRVRFNEEEVDLAPHTFGNVANLTLQ